MSSNKRPLDDDYSNVVAKKLKSGSSGTNGDSAASTSSEALIARAKAEIAAKIAAVRAKQGSFPSTPAVSTHPTSSSLPSKPNGIPGVDPDLARKVAEAKKLVAQRVAKQDIQSNPYLAAPSRRKAPTPPPAVPTGGLDMPAHPLLAAPAPTTVGQSKKDKYKPMVPKFASTRANARTAAATPPVTIVPTVTPKLNPYTSGPSALEGGFEGAPKERSGRQLKFAPHGKYMAQAEQARREAQLEELKQKIAENAKKAGLGEEFETLEKSIRREPPPEIEWWDEPLLRTKSYDDIERGLTKIRTDDSPITIYVQHPIPIPAPWLKNEVQPKALMLTKKELKKMRKQRRQAELQDHQDRVRMGLIPPDAPKVRLANLMKVLTSAAVQDPTKVEGRVRREVAMRKEQHEKMNEERKLTDEQRREKLETKKAEEERKGLYGAVFKIKHLTDAAHKFKVRKNAEQYGLTGICIFHPSFSLVFVEGSSKAIKGYKRLMLVRMKWTEASQPRAEEPVEIDYGEAGPPAGASTAPPGEQQPPVGLEDNRCDLIWEGPLLDRTFTNFRPKACPSDALAREALGEGLKGYWDVAKNWVPEDEIL